MINSDNYQGSDNWTEHNKTPISHLISSDINGNVNTVINKISSMNINNASNTSEQEAYLLLNSINTNNDSRSNINHIQSNTYTMSTYQNNSGSCTSTRYLLITSMNEKELFMNYNEVIINEFGWNTNWNKRNRFVFFGIDPDVDKVSEHPCEVVLNLSNVKNMRPQPVFYIYYNTKLYNYYWKSLAKDLFFSHVLQSNKQWDWEGNKKYTFKLGKIVVVVRCDHIKKGVIVKVNKNEKYSFDETMFPVTIGRANCSVTIKDESISKVHVTIDFDKESNRMFWYDHGSTNGTQLLLREGRSLIWNADMKFNISEEWFQIEIKEKNV